MTFEGGDFDSRDFRRSVWQQTATTVALVTVAHEGRENVMACEWAMMVTSAPMRFVISVSPRNETYRFIEGAGEFGLNFASDAQAPLSHISGSYSIRDTNKWGMAEFVTYPAHSIGAPMLAGCGLNLECRLTATNDLGDHTLFIGEVVWARCDPEQRPLIYHGGKYWYLGEQVPKS